MISLDIMTVLIPTMRTMLNITFLLPLFKSSAKAICEFLTLHEIYLKSIHKL